MKKKSKSPKLALTKQTLTRVAGGDWHRTTHRCHETFNGCSFSCNYTECYTCPEHPSCQIC